MSLVNRNFRRSNPSYKIDGLSIKMLIITRPYTHIPIKIAVVVKEINEQNIYCYNRILVYIPIGTKINKFNPSIIKKIHPNRISVSLLTHSNYDIGILNL